MTRIFLSYGREDARAVEQLYQRLKNAKFDPWMDQEQLKPGTEWRNDIAEEIKRADFFLACLSSRVIEKSSYRQREVREALDIAKEKPFGAIYLIPVKLDACELPAPLQSYHWVNYSKLAGSSPVT